MGALVCKRAQTERVLLMGLDASGKTTILYRMKLGQVVTTIPTIGFNVETVSVGGIEINCWDLGGRDKIRPLYRHYMGNCTNIVYVVDSNDRERLEDSMEELFSYYIPLDETRNYMIMVLANKQDLENALSVQDIESALENRIQKLGGECSQTFFVRPVSATAEDGFESLHNAFKCLMEQSELKKKGRSHNGLISLDVDTNNKSTIEDKPNSLISSSAKYLLKDPFGYLKSFLFH